MWILLSFLTALFTSLQEIITKRIVGQVNHYVIAWGWVVFSLPFLAVLLLMEESFHVGPQFWSSVFFSAIILTAAIVYYVKAIEVSDLSLCIPILAFTPLFLLVTSPIMVGEFPGPIGLVGVIVIVVGSYVLNIKDRAKGYLMPFKDLLIQKGPRYMLFVAFIFSIGANIDKIGVINSSPVIWLFTINVAVAIALTFLMVTKVNNYRREIKANWLVLIIAGFFNAGAILFQMYAIELTIVPYLIAIKRLSSLMTALFGLIILKEEGFKERLTGALLMVLGVFLIAFS